MNRTTALATLLLVMTLALPTAVLAAPKPAAPPPVALAPGGATTYLTHDFSRLIGTEGFSETLLRNHFKLYEGYVVNTNKLGETLKTMAAEGRTGPEFAELKRRFGWEWNGMRLHELYFGNLGGKGDAPAGRLAEALTKEFGSIDAFRKDLLATGALRGIGWVVLYRDGQSGRLFNAWVNEHDVGHPAGATPLLVLDVFEHAFLTDYGLKRADYLEAWWKAIDWTAVEARMR